MGALLISYDLHGQNYQPLYEVLTRLGGQRILESVWVLPRSSYSTEQVRDLLISAIGPTPQVFVVRLVREAAWQGLPPPLHNWLNSAL